jgi:hypothetical protein
MYEHGERQLSDDELATVACIQNASGADPERAWLSMATAFCPRCAERASDAPHRQEEIARS